VRPTNVVIRGRSRLFASNESANAFIGNLKQSISLEKIQLYESNQEHEYPILQKSCCRSMLFSSGIELKTNPILRPLNGPADIFGCYLVRSSDDLDFVSFIFSVTTGLLRVGRNKDDRLVDGCNTTFWGQRGQAKDVDWLESLGLMSPTTSNESTRIWYCCS